MGAALPSQYELLELLGAGGTAAVHRARDLRTGEVVALKILRGVSALDARHLEREAEVLAALRHEHVVRYVDHGRTGEGELFLAMQWIDGEPLSARLVREALPVVEIVRLMRQVVAALEAAHAAGVVHRDLKPHNILLAGHDLGRPILIDFGLAKVSSATQSLTRSGVVVGTPAYMAPEQARGSRDVDARADMFAVGCVLFECLTGVAPFVAEHVWATLAKVLFDEPASVREARPDVSAELEALVERLLSKDPSARPSAAETLAILDDALSPGAGRGAPARRFAAAEKRLISVVVVGVATDDGGVGADVDTLVPGVPPAVAGATLARVRASSGPFGALVERLAGGHILAILRGQGTAPDRVAHAARCALAIRRDVPDAPIVLATGIAVVDDRLPIGALIDHAARLLREHLAPGPDGALPVLLDPVSAGLLDGRFEIAQHGGLIELWRERPTAIPVRTLLGRPAPFVGRERELLMLEGMIAQVEAESVARAVLITGDAGVGKSRLRHELMARLDERGWLERTWIDRGDPMSAGAPFGMVARALRRALGLADGLPPDARRARLAARIGAICPPAQVRHVRDFLGELLDVRFPDDDHPALAAARRDPVEMGDQVERAFVDFVDATTREGPLLVVLDDLHAGDLPSVRLLEVTLAALADRPIGLVALARPDVTTRFPDLWSRIGCARWPLAELSRRACERLVRQVVPHAGDDEIQLVVERAAGNAFLLEELIRCVSEGRAELPATALAVVQARLDALDADARRVLRAAAIFGSTFWRGGVQHLLGSGAAASEIDRCLASLAAGELITPQVASRIAGDREYGFRHLLVREATYASLDEADRQLGHLTVGTWLEAHGETSAMALARHLDLGGAGERAAAWYHHAAVEALAGHDFAAVHERVARGRALTRDRHLDGQLLLVDSEAHRWTGRTLDAVVGARQAIACFEEGDDAWLRAVSQTGLVAALGKDFTLAEDVARMLSGHAPRPDCRDRWRIACAMLAARLLIAGRRTWARRLLDAAGDPGPGADAAVIAWLARAHAVEAGRLGDPARAAALMADAAAGFERAGDERNAAIQRLNRAEYLIELGALDLAHELAATELERRLSRTIALHARSVLAKLVVYGDRPALLPAIAEPEDEAGAPVALLLLDLAEGHRRAGDLASAERMITRALEALEPYPVTRAAGLAVEAMIALDRGRPEDALASARTAFHSTTAESAEQRRMQIVLAYVLALEATGHRDEAAARAGEARRELEGRAAAIADPELAASFLGKVSIHRELVAAARRLGTS